MFFGGRKCTAWEIRFERNFIACSIVKFLSWTLANRATIFDSSPFKGIRMAISPKPSFSTSTWLWSAQFRQTPSTTPNVSSHKRISGGISHFKDLDFLQSTTASHSWHSVNNLDRRSPASLLTITHHPCASIYGLFIFPNAKGKCPKRNERKEKNLRQNSHLSNCRKNECVMDRRNPFTPHTHTHDKANRRIYRRHRSNGTHIWCMFVHVSDRLRVAPNTCARIIIAH